MTQPLTAPLEDTVAIVGVGLIGGSIAAAVRRRGVARRVIGVGRNRERLTGALTVGLIDEISTDLIETAKTSSLIVFCTPVDDIVAGVRQIAPHVAAETILTDAGSVKAALCGPLEEVPAFIGSHPIAGKEVSGYEHADSDLFVDRTCVVTPLPHHSAQQRTRLQRFWEAIGMRVVTMTPADHDAVLARTSHVPHVVAAAVAAALPERDRPLTGTGFRSTTRIAAGPPDLWTGILSMNRDAVLAGIEQVQERLSDFSTAIRNDNTDRLHQLLLDAKTARHRLDELS
ncbi:MAG TPA: prephenate dehydrogenase [Planctomycetaceae bacterium]|jgi:prephenate dehydrogenase|nr:prephenate dehydrogenase [Planctomycetaceae bacterium]